MASIYNERVEVSAAWIGRPGDLRDLQAQSIVEKYGGAVIGAGTFLPTNTRDIQIMVPRMHEQALKDDLRKAGLRIEGDPITPNA